MSRQSYSLSEGSMLGALWRGFWFSRAPRLLLIYWIIVAIYCFFVSSDVKNFILIQLVWTFALLFGLTLGFYWGTKDCAKRVADQVIEMERNYKITLTKRDERG